MKGQLSLEYIVKLVIVLVVLAIIVGLIIMFKEDIFKAWKNLGGENKKNEEAELIKGTFSSGQIANFIESCWAENKQSIKNKICYILEGSFSASNSDVLNNVEEEIRNNIEINTDFSSKVIYIRYDFGKNKVVVGG